MERDDELWPPFGPGAEFRQGPGRAGRWRQDDDRRARPEPSDPDRRRAEFEQKAAEFQRRAEPHRRRPDFDDRGAGGHARRAPGPGQGPRGRSRPVLSREDIVAAAISIADRFGAEAVSIRKIAQLLQSGAMSLYWHLASKEHLLELMLDDIQGEVGIPEPSGDWRADLRLTACSLREVMLRHAWVVDFFGSRPPLGPKTLRSLDDTLALFDNAGLDLATAINVVQAVDTYVSGAVMRELQEARTQREQDEFVADDSEFFSKLEYWKDLLAASGQFGHFIRMLDEDIDPDAEETRQERFEFGLDCLLDGIAVRLAGGGDQGYSP
ncbi:MAG TPA: TetR/AcrR family transcriptional regulator C-terminal domain-containing protein [Streptosporangiaceae bacterium]|nr:TetR/AcrR family transcriptional regulator C-terminal domain-containing protein [Streptosporangiaceae bacterium]